MAVLRLYLPITCTPNAAHVIPLAHLKLINCTDSHLSITTRIMGLIILLHDISKTGDPARASPTHIFNVCRQLLIVPKTLQALRHLPIIRLVPPPPDSCTYTLSTQLRAAVPESPAVERETPDCALYKRQQNLCSPSETKHIWHLIQEGRT